MSQPLPARSAARCASSPPLGTAPEGRLGPWWAPKRSLRRFAPSLVALLLAAPAAAGTWSISFPAALCRVGTIAPAPSLVDLGLGTGLAKPAFAFDSSGAGEFLYCEVAFPLAAVSNVVSVNLTWTSTTTTPSTAVCWQGLWEMTLPGENWRANLGDAVALTQPAATAAPLSALADVRSTFSLTAVDGTGTACTTGAASGSCAGSHGILQLARSASAQCPSEFSGIADLTWVELSGVSQ